MKFECEISPSVALYDVSHLLPKHRWKKCEYRDPKNIDTLFIHHSGRLGKPGLEGIQNSARFVVRHRKFPGFPYTFWVPYQTFLDDKWRMVLFRGQPDNVRSWHTGGLANNRGVALALQGNTTRRGMSGSQVEILEAMIPWAVDRYGLALPEGLSWHSRADEREGRRKAACPGKDAEKWLSEYLLR